MKKKKKIKSVILVITVILAVFILLAFALIFIKLNRISFAKESSLFSPTSGNIVNILLLGSDKTLSGTEDIGRADSIMLASFNKRLGTIKLVSFERAMYVDIPGVGQDLLTHSYHYGGPELTSSIVSDYFNVNLAGYAHVDFDSFSAVIDAIGGVDICLTKAESDALNGYRNTNAYARSTVHEGENHLDGHDALQYCRLRAIDDDWHRVQRQRNTIQSIITAAKGLGLSELNAVADVVLPLIDTNVSKSDIAALLLNGMKFVGIETSQITIPEDTSSTLCDFKYESIRLNSFLYDK